MTTAPKTRGEGPHGQHLVSRVTSPPSDVWRVTSPPTLRWWVGGEHREKPTRCWGLSSAVASEKRGHVLIYR